MKVLNVMSENPALAVHLHLYYLPLWPEIKNYLKNIQTYPYDLYVTMNKDDPEVVRDILDFHENAKIFVLENRGYDVGPFIYFLHQIDLAKYDLILKIHSKNPNSSYEIPINHKIVDRPSWVKLLYDALLKSPDMFMKNISAFQKDAKLGMVGSKYCITSNSWNSRDVRPQVMDMLAQWGITHVNKIAFVSGTMFMVRASLMQHFKDAFSFQDFEKMDKYVGDGTLAHILERVFGCYVVARGYKLKGFDSNWKFFFSGSYKYLLRFLFQKKVTNRNYLQIKICKIPVYHIKVK